MRNIISITVSADHRVCCPEWDIARTGENDCTRFEITFAEELSTYSAYIDFEKPDGEKFKTPRLNIENNRIIYDLPSAVLDVKGNLLVQLVLQNDEGEIWKSNVQKFYVSESVDATEAIVEKDDFVADIEKRVKELNVGLKNKVDKLDTNNVVYATDNSTPAKTIGIQYMESPFEGTIPIRDGIGSLQVPTAQDATQAVNKGQMDTALDGKVDKTTEHFIFYGTDSNGEPYYYRQDAMDPTKWSVPIRNGYGAIVANRAQQDMEVVNLIQMNTALAGKADKLTGIQAAYINDSKGKLTLRRYDYEAAQATIAIRGDDGALKVGTPTADNHATTKKYVDDAIATAAVLVSPNGTKYKLTVSDDGTLSTAKVD